MGDPTSPAELFHPTSLDTDNGRRGQIREHDLGLF